MTFQTQLLSKSFLLLAFLYGCSAFGQKEGNIWYFGVYAGLDFNSGNPVPLTNGALNSSEACASISSPTGDLLFYTNGVEVWNANHAVMPNGSGLLGDVSNTQCIIVKQPGPDPIYFIFTTDENARGQAPFGYSVVDMGLNGGLGDVTLKNIGLFNGALEKMTAIPHSNGVDSWVLTHELGNSVFRAYLLNCDGLDTAYVSSNIGSVHSALSSVGGMKGSLRGDRVAATVAELDMVEVFDFDNSSGVLSNPIQLSNFLAPYSVEFSPDGSKFYVSNLGNVVQYDLSAPSLPLILASQDTVPFPFGTAKGSLQLGPDSVLYIARFNRTFLSGITNPNNLLPMAGFVDTLVHLNGRLVLTGLPPIYSRLYENISQFSFSNPCFGDTVFFSGNFGPLPDSVQWDFGDPVSGLNNESNLLDPFHVYANPGSYQTTLISYRSCRIDTVWETVVVDSVPDLGPDSLVCDQAWVLLDAGISADQYLWSNGDTARSTSVNSSGLYWVEVLKNGCSMRDSIQLTFNVAQSIDLGRDTSLCGDSILLTTNFPSANHLWSTGQMTSSIWVSDPGLYSVQVSGLCEPLFDSIDISLGQLPIIRLEDTIQLCGVSSEVLFAGNPGASYSWQQSFNGIDWQEISDSSTFTVVDPGQYQLEVTNDCGASTSPFWVEIDPDSGYFVPNVFTPNGDQINDEFSLSIDNPEGYSLSIFDRWGKLMFQTTNPNSNWDGDYHGLAAGEGVYFYTLHVRSCFGKLNLHAGSLTLVR